MRREGTIANEDATVVVAGAGIGGLRTVEELRRAGHRGELVLVGAEKYPPYDRPPLSKGVLRGSKAASGARLRDDAFFADNDVVLRLGTAATSIDPIDHRVALDDGTTHDYDQLIIATGLRPRTFPPALRAPGVHALRSLDDCLAIRQTLSGAGSVLVIGAGFIGCEVAATLTEMGLSVCVVEQQPVPFAAVLGDTVGEFVARLHRSAGVDLRCGVGVHELIGAHSVVAGAVLSDGSEVEADVVVVGIGSEPVTEWLDGSGVRVGDGVLCDERGRTSVDGVWAVGDVAAWRTQTGAHRRIEHWTRAGEQARIVAHEILGCDDAEFSIPYLWTDQYGIRIQIFGDVFRSELVWASYDDNRKFVAVYAADGIVTGVVGAGTARKVRRLTSLIGRPTCALDEVAA
ncbi:Reductase C-terminal [Haloechinothrix alba]|uniref:Reductase C-terminal n=1 Tax=Haloechinothrix alba TaxID=664784 RepID=A0A239A5W1_9PSEU|nr:FAD-dependent oxidoreductase [Haloechinothrix alba]SNR91046.1 Reductase C-terminal [Haloechinothrix alba]